MSPPERDDVCNSFAEMAQKLSPSVKLEDSTQNETQESDFVSKLKQLRVNASDYSGLSAHNFKEIVNLENTTKKFYDISNSLFDQRLVEEWCLKPNSENLINTIIAELSLLNKSLEPNFIAPAIFSFKINDSQFPTMPPQYAFKGGVARKALAQLLQLNIHTTEVRDIDIISFGNRDEENDQLIAQTLMQDDWLFAKNPRTIIDIQESIKGYFRTREFTINQVFLQRNKILCTAQCLADLIAGIIRPTSFHLRINSGKVESIVAAKAVRFYSEGRIEGREMHLSLFKVKGCYVKKFHLALHFIRALERSEETALLYMEEMQKRGLTKLQPPNSISNIIKLLSQSINQPESFFRI